MPTEANKFLTAMDDQEKAVTALIDAARLFIAKVEDGRAYSKESYAQFKSAILALDDAQKRLVR
jgi:hypothetical protein